MRDRLLLTIALLTGIAPTSFASDFPRFALVNWDGRPLTNENLVGKTTIVVPTFAKCVFACPMVTFLLAELDKELDVPPDIQYLLVSVNPDADTAEEILLHFDKHDLDPRTDRRWLFANGPRESIEKLLAETGVTVTRTRMEEGVLTEHTIRVDVVGPTGGIVKSFDTYFWDSKEMTDALESTLERQSLP